MAYLCYYLGMNPTDSFHKFKDALRYALANYDNVKGKKGKRVERGQALRHIANSLIHLAINGAERDKMPAIKELIDRLDGKAVQAITGPDGEQITIVQRVIVQQVVEPDPDALTIEQDPKLLN